MYLLKFSFVINKNKSANECPKFSFVTNLDFLGSINDVCDLIIDHIHY